MRRDGTGWRRASAASPYGSALVLGFATGLRSMMGVACVSRALAHADRAGRRKWRLHRTAESNADPVRRVLASKPAGTLLPWLAAGELIADKLPIPARTTPGPLAARALLGGVCGLVIGSGEHRSPLMAALLGAGAAVAGAYAGYALRRVLTHERGAPDVLVALAEDGAALALASRAAQAVG